MPDLQFFSLKNPTKTLWSGQILDETTLSMTISGSLLQGKIEQDRLILIGSNPTGNIQTSTWYKISQMQANQYIDAFDAYVQARLAFALLRQTISSPPPESCVEWYGMSVQSAERYVGRLSEKREQLKGLSRMCGSVLLAQFWKEYPPAASQFVLSVTEKEEWSASENARATVESTTVWKQLREYEQAWVAAEKREVPEVEGMSQNWRVDSEELDWGEEEQQQGIVEAAGELVRELEAALRVDYESMKDLKKKAEEIGREVGPG